MKNIYNIEITQCSKNIFNADNLIKFIEDYNSLLEMYKLDNKIVVFCNLNTYNSLDTGFKIEFIDDVPGTVNLPKLLENISDRQKEIYEKLNNNKEVKLQIEI